MKTKEILKEWRSFLKEEKNKINGIDIQPNQKPMTANSFASPKPIPSFFLTCL